MRIEKEYLWRHAVIFCTALMALFACNNALADIDADTDRKFSAIKAIALSSDDISSQQVARELGVELETRCSHIDDPVQGKYEVCIYSQSENEKHTSQLAFIHYKTVNHVTEKDTGGSMEFFSNGGENCIHRVDLINFFKAYSTEPTKVLTEPTLPYLPESTYDLILPKQGRFDVSLHILQTGKCITTLTLYKTAYHTEK